MSSRLIRLGLPAVLGAVLASAIASAQDRKPNHPTPAHTVAVFNPIEGRTVVLTAKPDEASVEAGETVCEFDPADLRDRLASQEIVVHGAQAEAQATRIAREVAFLALREFKDGTYKQQLATVAGEIKLAESKLSRAEDRVDWTQRMYVKGYASMAEKVSEELALEHARFALEQAQTQRMVLVEYSRDKTIKALTGAIESARARELAAQAVLEREQALQKKLADQLNRCKVTARVAGRIEYSAPFGAGAVVHDGQVIFRVITDAAARAKAQ